MDTVFSKRSNWYLELILLRSFGFNGSYACRQFRDGPVPANFFHGLSRRLGDPPHPSLLFSHLNIDNNSLNSYHTAERIREYVDFKELINTGFGL